VDGVVGEQRLCLFRVDAGVDDDVLALLPVDRRRDAVLVAKLDRVDRAQDLVKVTPSNGGVRERETDDLLRVDDEDGPDRKREALQILVRRVLVVEHIVDVRHLAVGVGDNGELDVGGGDFAAVLVDVLDPFRVVVEVVGGDADDLDVALCKVGCATCDFAELGRADGCKVSRVREEDTPRVTEPFVEVDRADGGLCVKVGGNAAETESIFVLGLDEFVFL